MRLFEKDGRKMAARTDIQAAAFWADNWAEVVVQPVGSATEDDEDDNREAELLVENGTEEIENPELPKRGRKPKGA